MTLPAVGLPAIVTLEPGDDAIETLRQATGESVVVVIRPGRDAGDLSLVRAAIGAAALARAPGRINAVQPGDGVAPAAVAQAVAFLAAAPAITGQVVELNPPALP